MSSTESLAAGARDTETTSQVDFDAFVAAASRRLLATAYLLTGDHGRAEDLLQTALAKTWLAWALSETEFASGHEAASTNQRMEIRAALEAVSSLSGPLLVVSDSTYVVNCFRDRWYDGWLARGWTTSARKPVANRDLWEPLVTLVAERGDVAFQWVKGHSGHAMNDFVDRLAVAAARAG